MRVALFAALTSRLIGIDSTFVVALLALPPSLSLLVRRG